MVEVWILNAVVASLCERRCEWEESLAAKRRGGRGVSEFRMAVLEKRVGGNAE
jgi:hypothetical protein